MRKVYLERPEHNPKQRPAAPKSMARRSQRLSSGSKVVPSPSHKRAASNTASPNAKAKRSKTTKATTTKSQYFKDPKGKGQSKVSEDDEDVEESSSMDDDESDFGDEADDLSSSDAEEGDDYDDESDEAPKSRMKATPGKGSKSSPAIRTKGGEMWREGVKAGLGPGTQMVIKKPQARAAGKTPYQDDRIHPNTLLFLKDLKQNNDRQWLKSEYHSIPSSTAQTLQSVLVSWRCISMHNLRSKNHAGL